MLFTLVGYIHPVAIFHLLIVAAWVTCFVTGVGLYFSARFGHTTAAVVATFALVLGLWAVGPILAGLLSLASRHGDLLAKYMWAHPMVQTEVIMAGTSGGSNAGLGLGALTYGGENILFGLSREPIGFGKMTAVLLITAGLYILAGLWFFWLARRRLRQNVF